MTKRTLSLTLDAGMLLAVVALHSWRLTGVPLHEWIGVALGAAILGHVLIHFAWIESRTKRLREPGARRNRVNVALNGSLFAAMAAALASGLFMSKSLFPGFQPVAEYLKWHAIHETSSNVVLVLVGLHLALNWELIVSGVTCAFDVRAVPAPAPERPGGRAFTPAFAVGLKRAALVAATAGVVGGAAWAVQHALPAEASVTLIHRDGRREQVPPPQEIANLRPEQLRPDPGRGAGRAALRFALLAGVVAAGRRVLRLRLE
jgi:hypothetical protein